MLCLGMLLQACVLVVHKASALQHIVVGVHSCFFCQLSSSVLLYFGVYGLLDHPPGTFALLRMAIKALRKHILQNLHCESLIQRAGQS